MLVYEKGAISKKALDRGIIKVSGLAFQTTINTAKITRETIKEARIIPQAAYYVLAERYIITPSNLYWDDIDANSFLGKNLYNATLYIIRQHFFDTSRLLSFKAVYHQVKADYPQDYTALPRKVANQVLKQVYSSWVNYFKALKAYKKDADGAE